MYTMSSIMFSIPNQNKNGTLIKIQETRGQDY